MKKNILPALAFVILALNACSTAKYVYSPSTANMLEAEKKNSAKTAINYSATTGPVDIDNQKSSGVDIQTMYAVTKRIAIKADGFIKRESNETATRIEGVPYDRITYKKAGFEAGAEIYNFSKVKERSAFRLYSGMGIGKFSFTETYHVDRFDIYHHSLNYFKFFIQPSVRIRASKNYSVSFAGKLSVFKFYHIKTDCPDLKEMPLGYIDTKPNLFTDIIIHHEFGFKALQGIRFQVQNGFCVLNTKFHLPAEYAYAGDQYEYHNAWVAAGIIADIKKLFAHK